MKVIDVLVVADDASALPASLSGRAATTDLTFVRTDPAHAATAIAERCDSPVGCLVVGVGAAAGAALEASAEQGNIHGFVSVAGELDKQHIGLLADWPELPLLAVASATDRTALDTAVTAYLAASHPASDLLVDDPAIDAHVVAWLSSRAAQRVDA